MTEKFATQIRFEEKTYDKLKIIAEREQRSLNAQMVYFILQSLKEYEKENGPVS